MITLSNIHEQIASAIKQSNFSQAKIAELLQVRQQTVSEYVNGKSFPALDTFANLCKVLDLDANEILCLR